VSHNENNQKDTPYTERKKISLQEAMQQKLASKNQDISFSKTTNSTTKGNQNMKSQQSKKRINQRSRNGV